MRVSRAVAFDLLTPANSSSHKECLWGGEIGEIGQSATKGWHVTFVHHMHPPRFS